MENLRDLVHVPSVQMHFVPTQTVGEALGMKTAMRIGVGVDDEDEVDVRVRGEFESGFLDCGFGPRVAVWAWERRGKVRVGRARRYLYGSGDGGLEASEAR